MEIADEEQRLLVRLLTQKRQRETDGGRLEWSEVPSWTRHREPPEQGGEPYWRCEGCAREIIVAIGREQLRHVDECPNTRTELK